MTRSRGAAAAAVLALHALLLWAWRDPPLPAERGSQAVQAPLVLRLPPLEPVAGDAVPLPAPARRAPPPVPALEVPSIAALPTTAVPAAAAAPVVPPAPAAPALPPPLVLDLPRAASAPRRNPALDDPRANTARATVESRIAKSMQKDWVEEVLGDGRTVWRRGDECVLVKPSRDAELDAFNASSSHRPKQAGNC